MDSQGFGGDHKFSMDHDATGQRVSEVGEIHTHVDSALKQIIDESVSIKQYWQSETNQPTWNKLWDHIHDESDHILKKFDAYVSQFQSDFNNYQHI